MEATLEAVKRATTGKNAKNEARRLRAAGSVPAVVYGAATGDAPASLPVSVDPKSLLRILHSDSGVNTLITLKLDGGSTQVLVKEYQRDPIHAGSPNRLATNVSGTCAGAIPMLS